MNGIFFWGKYCPRCHREKKQSTEVQKYSQNLEETVAMRTGELKDAQNRIVKTERLAAIGEMAGMVGHDFRNPLSGIKNAVYY